MNKIPTSPVEGVIKTRECVTGVSKSKVPFFPLKDKVVVKAIFEESALVVKDEQKVRQSNPKYIEVVGVGNEVENLEVGDRVHISFNASIEPLTFEGNDQSIKRKMNLIKDIAVSKSTTSKINMIEYYIAPAYSVTGIMTE